ncbi:MAG: hypothetical protein OXQ31_09240 [Spirochaetaceae bacterium]|nr:hypothetical protein [Spirochaetaceae bacterium]MDE0219678.1 hypothetical protein [Spirochaetaceae bacterium]
MTARAGPLRFTAAPVRDGTEPAGALLDELLRAGLADLPPPGLTVALLSKERHILAATVVRRGCRAGLVVFVAACAGCGAHAWSTMMTGAPADVRELLRGEPPPETPWCAALLDTRLLPEPEGLWPHVERLAVAWQHAAAVLGGAGPMTAAGCPAACADDPPDCTGPRP